MATDTKTTKPKADPSKRTTAAEADILEAALPELGPAKERLADLVEQHADCDREINRLQDALYVAPHTTTEGDDTARRARAILDGADDPGPTLPIADELPRLHSRLVVLTTAVREQRARVEALHEQASLNVWQQQSPAYRDLVLEQITALVAYAKATHAVHKFTSDIQAQGVAGHPPFVPLPSFGDPTDPRKMVAAACAEAVAKGLVTWNDLVKAGLPNRVAITRQQWADGQRAHDEAHEAEQTRIRAEVQAREEKARKEAEARAADEQGWSLRRMIFGN